MGQAGSDETRLAVLRRWLPLAALGAAATLVFALGLGRYFTFDALAENREVLVRSVARLGAAAPFAYIVVYGAITALSLPGAAVLTLAGGFLFGTLLGGAAALVGATIGATAVFCVARTSLGALLERRAGPRLRRLEAGFRANAASYLLVLRLVPLFPFWLVNLVAGLFGVKLATFVLCSLVGMAPGAFVYASLGAGLGALLDAGRTPDLDILLAPRLMLPLLGLAALALLPVLLKRRGAGAVSERIAADLCVVGAGAGGLSVAAGAAQLGAATVLIERGRMGGDCLNYGCVPSKALLAAAKRAQAMREAGGFGLGAVEPDVDFAAVMRHVRGVIEAIAPQDSEERFTGLGVRVIRAGARFIGPREVEAGGVSIRARRIVLATGARPALPPIPGLADVPFFTNETLFDNEVRPDHLVIIGGGPIGIEMAQAHRLLGARVTVLEAERALAKDDPELAALLLERLGAQAIAIREGVRIVRVERAGAGIAVIVADGSGEHAIAGSHLLVAVGRRASFDGLDLAAAGIATDARGRLVLDRRLRTTNRRVYAVGDAAGGPQFTHAAAYHAGIVIRNTLFRLPAKVDERALPWVTYTAPELAQVGLTEAAARARHRGVTVLRWPFCENDRAQAERATGGLVKIVASRDGRVLGASILGEHAGELIQLWGLAIARGVKLSAIAAMIAPYPTLGEASKRAAGSFYAPRLFGAGTRRLVRLLAWFG